MARESLARVANMKPRYFPKVKFSNFRQTNHWPRRAALAILATPAINKN